MDPGTALGAVPLSIQVCRGIVSYYISFRNFHEEVDRIIRSTEILLNSLEPLEKNAQLSRDEPRPEVFSLRQQVHKSVSEIKTLNSKYQHFQEYSDKYGFRATFHYLIRRASYPLRTRSLAKLKEPINDDLRNLNVYIGLSSMRGLETLGGGMQDQEKKRELEEIGIWLDAPDHSGRHREIRERHLAGTGEWFIRGNDFATWLTDPGVLWITGTSGCGKTMLCSTIIEETREHCRGHAGRQMAYYYYAYNNRVNCTAEKLGRSLLHQFSMSSNGCAPELKALYQNCKASRDPVTIDQLSFVVEQALSSFEDAYIILDALDEAPDQDTLWKFWKGMSPETITRIHLLLVSHDEIEIGHELETIKPVQVTIGNEEVDSDIRAFVRHELETDTRLLRLSPSSREKIFESLMLQKASGMFQIIENQLERLKECSTGKDLNEALKTLPDDLNQMWRKRYDDLTTRTSAAEGTRLLVWLCFCQRPMELCELRDALAIPHDWCNEFDLDEARLTDSYEIFKIGSGLVAKDRRLSDHKGSMDQTMLRLGHTSLKKWLTSENAAETMFPNGSPFSEETAHAMLAKDCMLYLMQLTKANEKELIHKDLPLATYAANYWRYHLQKSEISSQSVTCACDLLLQGSVLRKWMELLREENSRSLLSMINLEWLPLICAVESNLVPIVDVLVKEHKFDLNACKGWMTPLQVAVEKNHRQMIQYLINAKLDVNKVGENKISSLCLACRNGSADIVEILLGKGAVVDSTEQGVTALRYAANRKEDAITKLLLKHKASVDLKSGPDQSTALHAAAESIRIQNVQVLLEHGAKKDLCDLKGRLALHQAVEKKECTVELTKLLWFEGAESTADHDGRIPLFYAVHGNEQVCEYIMRETPHIIPHKHATEALVVAARRGLLTVLTFLHSKGVSTAQGGQAAVLQAVEGGHLEVIQYLVQQGHSLDVQDSEGANPFLVAVRRGLSNIWKYLVEQQGDVINAVDSEGRNACFLAASRKDVECIRWLVSRGVDFNHEDRRGITPLQAAAEHGSLEAVEYLVQKGADAHHTDSENANACHYAAEGGHLEILKWLADHNVDANCKDDADNTPFLRAVASGHLDCVEYLAKISPNWRARHCPVCGLTPLSGAVALSQTRIVKWMLQNDVDVNEKTDIPETEGVTAFSALMVSMFMDDLEMMRFLLAHKADPNIPFGPRLRALHYAAEVKNASFTKTLLEYGATFENRVGIDGNDCLMLSVNNPDPGVLQCFLKMSPDIGLQNDFGFTPMLIAAFQNSTRHFQLLQEAGFPCTAPKPGAITISSNDLRESSVYLALNALSEVYGSIDIDGHYSPHMVAAYHGHLDVVQYLFEQYPEIGKCKDKDGNVVLTYACCAGQLAVVRWLVENKMRPNIVNNAGRSIRQETETFLEYLDQDAEQNREAAEEPPKEDRAKTERSKAPRDMNELRRGISEVLTFLDMEFKDENLRSNESLTKAPLTEHRKARKFTDKFKSPERRTTNMEGRRASVKDRSQLTVPTRAIRQAEDLAYKGWTMVTSGWKS